MAGLVNLLSFDVEDWFQVEAFARLIPQAEWAGKNLRVEENVDRLLELLDRYDVKATFFTLGWVAKKLPHLVRRVAAEGHEIASHGWSHAPLWRLTPASFRDEVRTSKSFLEDLSGQAVQGYRAATFSITRQTLWGLAVLKEAGYLYDSSIFPVRHDRYGIPDAPLSVHLREEGIWEIPMTVYQIGSYRLPVAGGGYFRLYPYALTRRGIREANRAGRPAVVYLHPWEFDPGQPRCPGVSTLTRIRHYAGIGGNRKRLEKLLKEFRFTTARQILTQHGVPAAAVSGNPAKVGGGLSA